MLRPLPLTDQAFRVKLGHAEVVVTATSRTAAIVVARRELCCQLPRLWDVINNAADQRFEVEVVRS